MAPNHASGSEFYREAHVTPLVHFPIPRVAAIDETSTDPCQCKFDFDVTPADLLSCTNNDPLQGHSGEFETEFGGREGSYNSRSTGQDDQASAQNSSSPLSPFINSGQPLPSRREADGPADAACGRSLGANNLNRATSSKTSLDIMPLVARRSQVVASNNTTQHPRQIFGPQKHWELPPRTPRGRKRKDSADYTAATEVAAHSSEEVHRPSRRARRRGPLAPQVRELARTKRLKGLVCVICHFRKDACTLDADSLDAPCSRCKSLSTPCVRYKVTDAALYRKQDAPFFAFSQRWKSMEIVDITEWADDEIVKIQISQVMLDAPYELQVRKFVPYPGDMLEEKWTSNGKTTTFVIPPYGIANMEEAGQSLARMIELQVGNYILNTVGEVGGDDGELTWSTYYMAFRRASTAPMPLEQSLLSNSLRLWVTCRLTSLPEHIVGGHYLGMRAVDDPTSPLHKKIPLCPVMFAQLECIIYTRLLHPLSFRVLRDLTALFETKERRYWLTIYLVLFMLLHSCSMLTRRDMEYATQLGLPTEFCNPGSIKELHAGVTTLLAHYHLILRGSLPFKMALNGQLSDHTKLTVLSQSEINFVIRSAKLAEKAKARWEPFRRRKEFGDDAYWISQLFDQEWIPDKMS